MGKVEKWNAYVTLLYNCMCEASLLVSLTSHKVFFPVFDVITINYEQVDEEIWFGRF